MRLLATMGVIMIAVIASGLWSNHLLRSSTDALTCQINRVSAEVRGEQWEKAAEQSIKLEKAWEQKAKWWPVVLDHQEIDNIEFSLARVGEYVNSRDKTLSLAELSELKLKLGHIPRKEAVTLENIL